ncbi:SCO family protein [Roseovarius nanhaiticus]|uniref:SCO family protein n=1 Tax=Roseovarius nanhaiticus TaxID=573024 RepID=UPI00248F5351|nr:SCO family protein [Roseovarius nanhaiticus]
MSLTLFRKILWVLAGFAALAFVWHLLWADRASDRTGIDSDPPFAAEFELTDHRGMVRTEDDFAGRWMLVFFGFSNCPDVCPTTLSEVAAVMEGLGDDAARVQPIFITIDPERDTPEVLAQYVPLFDAATIGLTGTPGQIAETSETFPIFYERIEEAAAPNGYTMGHTSHLFLFDPEAGFANSWPYGTRAEEILADLRKRI